jgi:hypothetical protein
LFYLTFSGWSGYENEDPAEKGQEVNKMNRSIFRRQDGNLSRKACSFEQDKDLSIPSCLVWWERWKMKQTRPAEKQEDDYILPSLLSPVLVDRMESTYGNPAGKQE